jgi:hypothetical protein
MCVLDHARRLACKNVLADAMAAMRTHANQVSVIVERGAHNVAPRFGAGQDLALTRHAQRARRFGHILQDAASVDAAGASSIVRARGVIDNEPSTGNRMRRNMG